MDDFFDLLKSHLAGINLDEASEIVFCADGGKGIWPRTEKLITELGIFHAKQILDYTHAKQNVSIVKTIVANALKLADKERKIEKYFLVRFGTCCGQGIFMTLKDS